MLVQLPNGKKNLLTHAFHYGGPKWVMSCIQTHFNVDVERYVRVNFNVFAELVDAVGGVDIELTSTEAAALNHAEGVKTNTYPISRKVKKGKNHLSGFETLQYCRLRYTDSDWSRVQRQRTTIKAIQSRCRNLSVTELDNAIDAVLPMIQTNMDKTEILSMVSLVPTLLNSDIEDMTVPVKGTFKNLSNIDFKANSKILHDLFYGEDAE